MCIKVEKNAKTKTKCWLRDASLTDAFRKTEIYKRL